ncbi:hypothetical protein Cgig2_021654 [Carnegiea gigantea]|uniref:Aminotransferase-like plant mobile domain-containing protein n=1 Tax=Carnegiea gigantea TaxID=171969 RepID=A0A9Q1KAF2_9CARY|nr:hypothetical protein Cgig2_021654 [Carnegiea gigantea]
MFLRSLIKTTKSLIQEYCLPSPTQEPMLRDAGCIRSGTFSIASLMASGIGYCLPTAILASIYKGLNELSRSSYPGRSGGHFPAHFLYAWLAKNFDVYELVGEASSSSGMVKFSGLGRAKRCNLLERNTTHAFCKWWPKMFVSLTCSPHASDSKRKRSYLSNTNISKDEGKLGSKPKLKIVRSGKSLEPFIPLMEGGSSRVKIPGTDVVIPTTPIPVIPIQSIAPLPQDELPVGVCEPSTKKVIELPPEGAENIMDILDAEPNPTECMGESDYVNFKEGLVHVPLPSRSQWFPSVGQIPSFGKHLFDSRSRLGVCSPNDDEVDSIRRVNAPSLVPRPQCPLRAPQGGISVLNANAIIKEVDENAAQPYLTRCVATPFDGLPSLKGDLVAFIATILQRGADVTPLESKVEGLIKQACDLKDPQ